LLQILDDGRLTDNKGEVVSFENTIIILTSNLGSEHLIQALRSSNMAIKEKRCKKYAPQDTESSDEELEKKGGDLSMCQAKNMVYRELKLHFRPELLNRIDEVLIYDPLNISSLSKIIKHQLAEVVEQLKTDRNIDINITEDAIKLIVKESYDPEMGARPLRRWLERNIATELAHYLIEGVIYDSSYITISTSINDDSNRMFKNKSIALGKTLILNSFKSLSFYIEIKPEFLADTNDVVMQDENSNNQQNVA